MATKTEQQIERDFYSFVNKSPLGKAIKGKVYRDEMRPADAKTEDLIVKFYTGVDGQVQTGTVILDVYVPDITNKDGRNVKNSPRIAELQVLILDFIENNDNTEYLMETELSPYTIKSEEIEQHEIKVRIKFNRTTF